MRILFLISGLTLFTMSARGQGYYPSYGRHTFQFGLGAGIPRADLGSFFDPRAGLNVAYGYRFHRHFQADFGFETIFGAAGVKEFVDTDFGARRIRDYQYMLPAGGRTIIPVASGRLLLFGGGGGAYLRYQEQISQPGDYVRLNCPFCTARSGWGYYATAGFTAFFDRNQRFSFTLAPKVIRGYTKGEPLGAAPAARTRDHWVNVMGQFGISF